MKTLRLALTACLFSICSLAFGQMENYFTTDTELTVGESYDVFGNNIKFRAHPHLDSAHTELLPIHSKVKIIAKSEEIQWQNQKHQFYFVEHNGVKGYVLGAFIARAKITLKSDQNVTLLVRSTETEYQIHLKAYDGDQLISQLKMPVIGWSMSISSHASDFANLKEMIVVQYMGDACGEQSGKSYVFWNGNTPYHAADLSSVGDGGMYHEFEKFIFPGEEGNYFDELNAVVFVSESGSTIDEETKNERYRTVKEERKLTWDGKKFLPIQPIGKRF